MKPFGKNGCFGATLLALTIISFSSPSWASYLNSVCQCTATFGGQSFSSDRMISRIHPTDSSSALDNCRNRELLCKAKCTFFGARRILIGMKAKMLPGTRTPQIRIMNTSVREFLDDLLNPMGIRQSLNGKNGLFMDLLLQGKGVTTTITNQMMMDWNQVWTQNVGREIPRGKPIDIRTRFQCKDDDGSGGKGIEYEREFNQVIEPRLVEKHWPQLEMNGRRLVLDLNQVFQPVSFTTAAPESVNPLHNQPFYVEKRGKPVKEQMEDLKQEWNDVQQQLQNAPWWAKAGVSALAAGLIVWKVGGAIPTGGLSLAEPGTPALAMAGISAIMVVAGVAATPNRASATLLPEEHVEVTSFEKQKDGFFGTVLLKDGLEMHFELNESGFRASANHWECSSVDPQAASCVERD